MNPLHPKKLLLSKWTALHPQSKQKHFLVIHVIAPPSPTEAITSVEIEAIHSKSQQCIAWRELKDATRWQQGWH